MTRIWHMIAIAFLIMALFSGLAFAQDFVVYPAKGQSNEQTEKDKFECYGWTMAISEETGQVVLTASGDEVAFVVFGACLPM